MARSKSKKPVVIILHPADWATGKYHGKYDYHHISIGGKIPRKGNGTPTFDGYADTATKEGIHTLENAFKKHQPDLFLFWLHANFSGSVLARIRRVSPRTKMIMWFGNHRLKPASSVVKGRRYLSMVMLNSKDPRQIRMYRRAGIRAGTLWDGFAPDEINLREVKPRYDCVFGGNTYIPLVKSNHKGMGHKLGFPGGKIRYDFINQVATKFKTLVRTGYKTWPKHVKTAPEVFHPIYTSFLRDGKINLNTNHFPTLYQAYTRRTIRSIFSGRCHITLYIPGMEEHFTNHENIVWFKTIEEGIDQIRYYLDHDNEREEIAMQQHINAVAKFQFKHRLIDFETQTQVLLPKEKQVLLPKGKQ